MPSVFTFMRSDQEILQEFLNVFNVGKGNAREHWCFQAEMVMEPAGWNALWKLSKDNCRKYDVRYPCIAYVSVCAVDYENLSACIDVLNVQHESVTLPELVPEVPLIELWPTEKQSETCVDAQSTASFIDLLRFFYNNIWMPWDDHDGKELLPTTIEERMKLWTELHSGNIPDNMVRYVTMLRKEAIDAHKKMNQLDSSLCDGILADEDDSLLPPSYLLTCAEVNSKMESIMSQWSLYENSLIREQYITKMKNKMQNNQNKKHAVVLWEGGSVHSFESVWRWIRTIIDEHTDLTLTITHNMDDALALNPRLVLICSKIYELPGTPLTNIQICSYDGATLKSSDMRACLLNMSDECDIRDLKLDCESVNTVIVMRSGALHVENCILADDSDSYQSDFTQGLVAMSGSKILMKDCSFDNFYSGIVVHKDAHVQLWNCVIKNCGVAIQMYSGAQVSLYNTKILDCKEQSIRCEINSGEKCNGHNVEGLNIDQNCIIGSGDLEKEILSVEQDLNLI